MIPQDKKQEGNEGRTRIGEKLEMLKKHMANCCKHSNDE